MEQEVRFTLELDIPIVHKTDGTKRDFEKYLKNGSGKSFAYKRLVSVALKKDFENVRKGSLKSKT